MTWKNKFGECVKEINQSVKWEMMKFGVEESCCRSILSIDKKKAVHCFDIPSEVTDTLGDSSASYQFRWINFNAYQYVFYAGEGRFSKYDETISTAGDSPDFELLFALKFMKLKELKQVCRDNKFKGFSKYNKNQLLKRIIFTLLLKIPLDTDYSRILP